MVDVFVSSLSLVFLRAIQQQNVILGRYFSAAITPFFIAVAEVASILFVVNTGWSAVPFVGLGGAIGVVSAMWIFRRNSQARHKLGKIVKGGAS